MFFNNNTKVFVTTVQVLSNSDLALLQQSNTAEISTLVDISAQADSQPYVFSEAANVIGDVVERGAIQSPGNNVTYSLALNTYMCLTPQLVNNTYLWNGLLTGAYSSERAVKANYIDNQSNNSQLLPLTIIVVNGSKATVFSKCIVSGLSLSAGMSGLLGLSWNISALYSFETGVLNYTSGNLYREGVAVGYTRDTDLEYVVDKLMLISLDSDVLPAISFDMAINNNISINSTNMINKYNEPAHYTLGVQSIAGSLVVYTRVGTVQELANSINQAYANNSSTTKLLSIVLKSSSRQVRLTLGSVFILPSVSSYTKVYTTAWQYSINNYKNNSFKLEAI